METNRKALYNSLRMNSELDPSLSLLPWQVADYRSMLLETLFENLKKESLLLDKDSFLSFADAAENPEELTEMLLADSFPDVETQDKIYLILFELWRRFVPERLSLSIFCDELDHQIYLYDHHLIKKSEPIEDLLANLQIFLEENQDAESDPQSAFESINNMCANDLECFLFDFITEQIENKNTVYAIELLDGFNNYIHDIKWFELLRAEALIKTDAEESKEILLHLLGLLDEEDDLEFNLEILNFLVSNGNEKTFLSIAQKTLPLIESEEDFQSLLLISIDFYHRLDKEETEQKIQRFLNQRASHKTCPFDPKDPQIIDFLKMIKSR